MIIPLQKKLLLKTKLQSSNIIERIIPNICPCKFSLVLHLKYGQLTKFLFGKIYHSKLKMFSESKRYENI